MVVFPIHSRSALCGCVAVMVRFALITVPLLLAALTGCMEYSAGDLGRCHVDSFNSFCVVNTPPGTSVSTGTGIVPGVAAAAGGVGSLMIGQGAIVSGVGILVK
jgi:hypothetical protein